MRLLYTLCWLMICLGIFMIFGTLGYDIPILDTLTIENARTATEVQRDTWLILTGAAITTCSALIGMVVGFFVKPTDAQAVTSDEAN